jgi:hypothetical protein
MYSVGTKHGVLRFSQNAKCFALAQKQHLIFEGVQKSGVAF